MGGSGRGPWMIGGINNREPSSEPETRAQFVKYRGLVCNIRINHDQKQGLHVKINSSDLNWRVFKNN